MSGANPRAALLLCPEGAPQARLVLSHRLDQRSAPDAWPQKATGRILSLAGSSTRWI